MSENQHPNTPLANAGDTNPVNKNAPVIENPAEDDGTQPYKTEVRRRRRLLVAVLLLVGLLCLISILIFQYLRNPTPLPEMVPVPVDLNYPPHYLFSMYDVSQPVGIAASADGKQLYITESGGERKIKILDRDGKLIKAFSPPNLSAADLAPVYIAIDLAGRVFVSDRMQRAIFVFDSAGEYQDTILSPSLTLREYISKHSGGLPSGSKFWFNFNTPEAGVHYQLPGQAEKILPAPDYYDWAPLGIRFDNLGNMLVTDVASEHNKVYVFPAVVILAPIWPAFDPQPVTFGESGSNRAQFLFPNVAASDLNGHVYVTDGNNGRISAWDLKGTFLYEFGRGTVDGSLSLPRGAFVDKRNRLFVVDAVGQNVKVYDVSDKEPKFLYGFGDYGLEDGLFNFPADIVIATDGRLYIADKENNRIQVWSY